MVAKRNYIGGSGYVEPYPNRFNSSANTLAEEVNTPPLPLQWLKAFIQFDTYLVRV